MLEFTPKGLEFTPKGGVVTASLLVALIKDNGSWADAVLTQCYAMPVAIRIALLSGAAQWTIPNETTLAITLPESH